MISKKHISPPPRMNPSFLTMRISATTPNGIERGTGFSIYNHEQAVDLLITNRHTVQDALEAEIGLTMLIIEEYINCPKEQKRPLYFRKFIIDNIQRKIFYHPNKIIDLAAIDISEIQRLLSREGSSRIFYQLGSDELEDNNSLLNSIEEVLMFGYPMGTQDSNSSFPMVRSGITAFDPKLNFKGLPVGVTDIASFPGSSGSPIFTVRRVISPNTSKAVLENDKLLGVLFGGPTLKSNGDIDIAPLTEEYFGSRVNGLPLHLGFYIKAQEIKILLEYIYGLKR